MVSTRGGKYKFCDGEKVLCYEPDPTKAKVLYDSKVLSVQVNKDQRGRKAIEYLIHFQGWNSSWDRCVTEEYVLKDTEENRQLQRDLAEKAQLQLNAYLYRRERKKRSHKYSERWNESGLEPKETASRSTGSRTTSATTGSSEDGSLELQDQDDYDSEGIATEDEEIGSSSDYNGESTDDEGSNGGGSHSEASIKPDVDLDIGATLSRILQHDYELVVKRNKLLILPSQPTVVQILESWVQNFTSSQLSNCSEKAGRNKPVNTIEKSLKDINVCREVADGLRIYFDFTLHDLLLYRQEKEQYCEVRMTLANPDNTLLLFIKNEPFENDIKVKEEFEEDEFAHLPPFDKIDEDEDKIYMQTRRKLRSCRLNSAEESAKQLKIATEDAKVEPGNVSSIASTSSRCSSPRGGMTLRTPMMVASLDQSGHLMKESNKWKLLPDEVKKENPPSPCVYYGATHLARLFVKLPELLQAADIPEKKLKSLVKYLDLFLSFLETRHEWFGEQYYVDNLSPQQAIHS